MGVPPADRAEGIPPDQPTTRHVSASDSGVPPDLESTQPPTIQVGILTKGKPTLSMVLASLLLQETHDIRIHIVDTSDTPVVNRDDVRFALRLAFDRGISCNYEYSREKDRAFSLGRLRLLEALDGPHLCLMDDDIVLASSTLARIVPVLQANPVYGYVVPNCVNSLYARLFGGSRASYSPGGVIYQDAPVRSALMEYYSSTVDVLDRLASEQKAWEIAFLTELFDLSGRRLFVQTDNLSYHLDYQEAPNWALSEADVLRRSRLKARALARKYLQVP